MMKRTFFSVLMLMIVILSAAMAVCAQDNAGPAVPDEYKGAWAGGRAVIDLIRKDSGYIGMIRWGGGYDTQAEWKYTLSYDAGNNCLTDNGTGTKSTVKYGDNGVEISRTAEYMDGTARFSINDEGKLIWEDGKEDAGHDMQFEKMDYSGFMPTQEEFVNDFFHVIGGYGPGTAGSSLAAAKAAYKAYDFAQSHRLWSADIPTLRSIMLEAWESLTDKERSAFDTNFISIVTQIKDCMADWDANQGVFSDAGVPADRMGILLKDPEAVASWDALSSNTLTMGNSDESEVPEEEPRLPHTRFWCPC